MKDLSDKILYVNHSIYIIIAFFEKHMAEPIYWFLDSDILKSICGNDRKKGHFDMDSIFKK